MTPNASKLRDALLNAVLGVVGTLALIFGTGAWGLKEGKLAHDAEIRELRLEMRASIDSLRAEQRAQADRILLALCGSVVRVCK